MPVPRRLLLLVAPAALVPAAASAHAILIESTPASGASVPSGRVAFRLRYNSRIDQRRSRLTLATPDHDPTVLPIADAPTPDVITAMADLRPGAYVLRWQVLAVDGHITRGDVHFTVGPGA